MSRIITFLLASLLAVSAQASPLPDFPFVTVSGESSRDVRPNMATIRLQALVFEGKANSAQIKLEASTDKLLQVLKDNNIDLKYISSDQINKRARRDRNKYQDTKILGYEFSRQFTIELNDLDKYPSLSVALGKLENIVNISSQFDVTGKDDIEIELIAEASAKARKKARQMASGLGVKIDSVFAFNDTGSFQSFFATFGLRSDHPVMMRSEAMGFSSDKASFIPEYIKISKKVNVVYKLQN